MLQLRGRCAHVPQAAPWLAFDAVVSGGEPTAQRALPDAVRQVRELGYKVGLHSAGCYPGRLARVLGLVDWVGPISRRFRKTIRH